jgi:hypothetical protein
MSIRETVRMKCVRRKLLVSSLVGALGLSLSMEVMPVHAAGTGAAESAALPAYLRAKVLESRKSAVNAPAVNPPHVVTTCADDGSTGSLRNIIESMNTVSGDTIDLTQLPMMCSKITLAQGSGAIKIYQDQLYLQGPGAENLTIDADDGSSAFYHYGVGTLFVSDMTIANGYFSSNNATTGGCIYSQASVFLFESVVTNCVVRSTASSSSAQGGGVYTNGDLTLVRSAITESHADSSSGAQSEGGGAYVRGNLFLHESTVSGNTAFSINGTLHGLGGGIKAAHDIDIENSTIARNAADVFGGIDQYFNGGGLQATISNSTISGNVANIFGYGGIYTTATLLLANSTIAFNQARNSTNVGGLYASASTTIQSSIIAGNSNSYGASDLDGLAGSQVDGSNNLITSSKISTPAGTLTDCPKLDVLTNTGGATQTHGLRLGSPALGQGDPGSLTRDQRGLPRTVGGQTDIGSVERQAADQDERISVSGFDGLCDQ